MTPPARLGLAIAERPGVREAVERSLPGVPFEFLRSIGPDDRGSVEAILLGSIARDVPGWDPRDYPGLRFVQRLFAGVDDVPFGRLPASVAVAGNVGGYAPFVAEHAIALALAAQRGILLGQAALEAGRSRPAPELRGFYDETAVILGYGAIGRAIAERLAPFRSRVVGVSRTGTPAPGTERMYGASALREALAAGRLVFDARPLTSLTRGSIGAEELGAMAEDATFVNVGRGPTVVAEALYRHLVDHPRFRAALDVWWDEDFGLGRIREPFPFTQLPNFVGSPHWAGLSPRVEAYARASALENLARFFRGEPPRHVVDPAEYRPLAGSG